MYKNHFSLGLDPFSLTPDPAFLFPSDDHTEAIAGLILGLEQGRGLILMTGEVGTGKTTVLYYLLSKLSFNLRTAYVANTRLRFPEILWSALRDFGVTCRSKKRADLLEALKGFLLRCAKENAVAVIVIDEAQNLPDDTFEDLRLLLNFETYKSKLLQIVLAGQPELEARLESPSLRQVRERIAVRVRLRRLTKKQSLRYIEHRLKAAGGAAAIFTWPALRLAVRRSAGIPRRINIICHNALLFAYGRNLVRVNRRVVSAAIRACGQPSRGSAGTRAGSRALSSWRERILHIPWLPAGAAAGAAGMLILVSSSPMFVDPVAHPEGWWPGPEKSRASPGNMASQAQHQPPAAIEAGKQNHNGSRSRIVKGDGEREQEGSKPTEKAAQWHVSAGDRHTSQFIKVRSGTTLYSLTRSMYGSYTPELVRLVQSANPQIKNPNHILAGDLLRFPAPEVQVQVTAAP